MTATVLADDRVPDITLERSRKTIYAGPVGDLLARYEFGAYAYLTALIGRPQ